MANVIKNLNTGDESKDYDFGDVFAEAAADAHRSSVRKRKYSKGAYEDLNTTKGHRDSFFKYDVSKFVGSKSRSAPKKILNVYPQFDGDNRTNLCTVKSCSTCAFFKQKKHSPKTGFCLFATKLKFSKSDNPLIVPADSKNYARNKLYSEMNWVHTHGSMYCDSYSHSNLKLSSVDNWIRKYTNTDPSVKYRKLKGDDNEPANLKFTATPKAKATPAKKPPSKDTPKDD